MRCEEFGSGSEPLVCLHGWGCCGEQFTALAEEFGCDYRVYMPDLPGHGLSPLGDFDPGFETYSEALAEFIAAKELKKPILLGHSMGGVLALMTASRVEVRAIVSLDGSLPAAAHALAGQTAIRSWLDTPDFRVRLAGALREAFFLPHERDERCESIIRRMCAAPEAVLRFLPEKISSLRPAEILSQVRVPVLFVGASNPRFDAESAAELVRDAHFRQIPTAGHFLHIYALAEVCNLTRRFLAGLAG